MEKKLEELKQEVKLSFEKENTEKKELSEKDFPGIENIRNSFNEIREAFLEKYFSLNKVFLTEFLFEKPDIRGYCYEDQCEILTKVSLLESMINRREK